MKGLGLVDEYGNVYPEPTATPTGGDASIFSTIIGGVTDIAKQFISPANITPLVNKMVYGTSTMPVRAPVPTTTGGIPTSYLLIGAGLLAAVLLTGSKRR
jgi:hypothetical protein